MKAAGRVAGRRPEASSSTSWRPRVVDAEAVIPEDVRDRYRRTVKQHGADAMASLDYDRKSQIGTCSGCYVSVTTQALNELINGNHLSFCKTCGRLLYLPEEDFPNTRRDD